MPDRLTDAVVDIATQLRRIADAHTTDAAAHLDAATTTPDDGPRCVCGDPIEQWTGPGEPGWIHSPGSDTPCLDARRCQTPDDAPTALSEADRRSQYGQVLRRWGLLDEVNDPAAAEAFAVTDLLVLANAELEQVRKDVASSDEAARRAMEQRLKLAHQARRAKAAQLDDIKRAMLDTGLMAEGDPYNHADLADVIRQAIPDTR